MELLIWCIGVIRRSARRSSPCRGPCRTTDRSDRSTRWSRSLLLVRNLYPKNHCTAKQEINKGRENLRTPIPSPLSASTLRTPKLRMITFFFSLTSRPKPSSTALSSSPRMLVLLPTLTWSAASLIVPDTTTTLGSSLVTASVKAA